LERTMKNGRMIKGSLISPHIDGVWLHFGVYLYAYGLCIYINIYIYIICVYIYIIYRYIPIYIRKYTQIIRIYMMIERAHIKKPSHRHRARRLHRIDGRIAEAPGLLENRRLVLAQKATKRAMASI
jgi:hypothetical protein